MATYNQICSLVEAHYANDGRRFKSTVAQIAARMKNQDEANRLLRQTERLLELPQASREHLHALPARCWEEQVLKPEVHQELLRIGVELNHRHELEQRGLGARSRLLFVGPSGNGKTSTAAAFAAHLETTAHCVSLSSLIGQYVGSTGAHLASVFSALPIGALLVLDEIDAIGSRRNVESGGATGEANRIVNTLLGLLDRYQTGIVIGTTNFAEALDPALVRRFDVCLEFPSPSPSECDRLVTQLGSLWRISPSAKDRTMLQGLASYDAVTRTMQSWAREQALRELGVEL